MTTSGPRLPGTAATEIGPSGDDDWVTPNSILTGIDGTTANITASTFDTNDTSYRLKATNYGFSIPSDAVIDGITVQIYHFCLAGNAVDSEVRLYNSTSALVGDNKSGLTWPGSAVDQSYGGATDTWNAGLTATDINSSNFGVALIVGATGQNTDVYVDTIRVTVDYHISVEASAIIATGSGAAYNAVASVASSTIGIGGAFPTATATNGGDTGDSSSHSLNLPAASVGDLLIMLVAIDNDVTTTSSLPSGWTKKSEASDGDGWVHFAWWTRVVDGTEGSTVTITHSNAQACTSIVWKVSGASGTVAFATAGGWNGNPDPPNLTAPWGAANTLWLAAYGIRGWQNYYSSPVNYTWGLNARYPDSIAGVSIGTAKRALNAASENPGTFSTDSDRWATLTIAIESGGAAGTAQNSQPWVAPGPGSATGTGVAETPTITSSGTGTSASAITATGVGAAYDAFIPLVHPDTATGTGSALTAGVTEGVSPGFGAGTGAAFDAVGVATHQADAGVATGSGTALGVSTAITASIGGAGGFGSARWPIGWWFNPAGIRTVIRVAGVDITANVIIADAEFTSLVNGQPGQAQFRVRDDDQTFDFTAGQSLTLDMDGRRMWGGFVMVARKVWALPVVKTTDPTAVKRIWSIEGLDYNVLFTKRFIFKASDPAGKVYLKYRPSTYDDTIINDVFDHYLDLTGLDLTRYGVQRIAQPILDVPGMFHDGAPASAGDSWGNFMQTVARATGGVFYIDPYGDLKYVDVETIDSDYTLTDTPSEPFDLGYQNFEILANGSDLVNDMMVWGAGTGSPNYVFSRSQDSASIAEHGRWQRSLVTAGLYRQASADTVSHSFVYGTPQSHRGGKDDAIRITCRVFRPVLTTGQKVRFINDIFGCDDIIPIRQMTIKFVNPNAGYFDLIVQHLIDLPNLLYEYRFFSPPPITITRPPIPPIPPIGDPGGCSDVICGITDTFADRTVSSGGWGDASMGGNNAPYHVVFGDLTPPYGSPLASVSSGVGRLGFNAGSANVSGQFRSGIWSQATFPLPIDQTFDFNAGTGNITVLRLFVGAPDGDHALGLTFTGTPSWSNAALQIQGWNDSGTPTTGIDLTVTKRIRYRVEETTPGYAIGMFKVWDPANPEPSGWDSHTYQDVYIGPSSFMGWELIKVISPAAFMPLTYFEVSNLNVVGLNRCTAVQFEDFNRTVSGSLGATTPSGYPWRALATSGSGSDSVNGQSGVLNPTTGTTPWTVRFRRVDGRQPSVFPFQAHAKFKATKSGLGNIQVFPLGLDSPGDAFGFDFAARDNGAGGMYVEMESWQNDAPYEYLSLEFAPDGMSEATDTHFAAAVDTWYEVRCEVSATEVKGRVWLSGTVEPTGWATISTLGADYRSTGDYSPSGGGVTISAINAGVSGGVVVGGVTLSVDFIDFGYDGKPCYYDCGTPVDTPFDDFNRTTSGWGTASPSGAVYAYSGLGPLSVASVDGASGIWSTSTSGTIYLGPGGDTGSGPGGDGFDPGPWLLPQWTFKGRMRTGAWTYDGSEGYIDLRLSTNARQVFLGPGTDFGHSLPHGFIGTDQLNDQPFDWHPLTWYWVKWYYNWVTGASWLKVWADGDTEPDWLITQDYYDGLGGDDPIRWFRIQVVNVGSGWNSDNPYVAEFDDFSFEVCGGLPPSPQLVSLPYTGWVSEEFIATAGQTTITLSRAFQMLTTSVFINGLNLPRTAYTEYELDGAIVLDTALSAGDIVIVRYFANGLVGV